MRWQENSAKRKISKKINIKFNKKQGSKSEKTSPN